jgi:hypothetical protein
MSGLLLSAALVLALLGLVHSVLGELLIFRRAHRFKGLPVFLGSDDFCKRALRATWHTPSILGGALALLLGYYGRLAELGAGERLAIQTISGSLFLCAVVWSLISRGKHPGWVGFLAAAVLCWSAAG